MSNHDSIKYGRTSEGKPALWGCAGGQLEFVSMRTEWRQRDGDQRWYPVVVIRFTDHDVQATKGIDPKSDLIDGEFYELEFPIDC